MKNIYFNIASLFILVVIYLSHLVRKHNRGKINIAYTMVLVELFITTVVGTVSLYLDNLSSGHYYLKYIFHSLYLILHPLSATLYLVYLMFITDSWFKIYTYKFRSSLLFLPTIISFLIIVINFFTKSVFYISDAGIYTKTKHIYFLYFFSLCNLLIGAHYLIRYKDLFKKKTFYSIGMIFPLTIVPMIIEAIIPPLVIEPFGNTLAILVISMNIQRPEELIDPKTSLLNETSYAEDYRKTLVNKKETQHIFVSIINFINAIEIVGYESNFSLELELKNILQKVNSELKLKGEIYNLGNGQFRIIVEKPHFSKVTEAALRINSVLQEPITFDNIVLNLTANICIVRTPQEINNYSALMEFGKDITNIKHYSGTVLYAKDIFKNEHYQKLEHIDSILDDAFLKQNYSLYYQPIYSVKEKRFTCAEVLLRLNDPKFGFISPEVFIPIAEKSGLIHRIDSFVFEELCKFISKPEFKQLNLENIQVNFSLIHCMHNNLCARMDNTVNTYKVDPKLINIQVSEKNMISNEAKFFDNMQQLKERGYTLTLDNFGKGAYNLLSSAAFPIEFVKIDKVLIDSARDGRVMTATKKIIELFELLNTKTIALQIETPEELAIAENLGADYIQGHYFAKPMTEKDFIKFMNERT